MTEDAPPSNTQTQDDDAETPRWRRLFDASWLHTIRGLLVLGVVVGGLIAFDRFASGGSSDVGPLDGRTPSVGDPAPQFALRDPSGSVVELSDFDGQPVWINFWASWCGPCRRELPDIERVADEFEDEGLVVLEVNVGESRDTARDFFAEVDVDLPILLDLDNAVSDQYRLSGMPSNFFIDQDGIVRDMPIGFLTEDQMREKLAVLGLE